jgi:hypothetical protein
LSPSKIKDSSSPEVKLDRKVSKKVKPPNREKRIRRGSMRPEVMKGLEEILGDQSDITLGEAKPKPESRVKKPK